MNIICIRIIYKCRTYENHKYTSYQYVLVNKMEKTNGYITVNASKRYEHVKVLVYC